MDLTGKDGDTVLRGVSRGREGWFVVMGSDGFIAVKRPDGTPWSKPKAGELTAEFAGFTRASPAEAAILSKEARTAMAPRVSRYGTKLLRADHPLFSNGWIVGQSVSGDLPTAKPGTRPAPLSAEEMKDEPTFDQHVAEKLRKGEPL